MDKNKFTASSRQRKQRLKKIAKLHKDAGILDYVQGLFSSPTPDTSAREKSLERAKSSGRFVDLTDPPQSHVPRAIKNLKDLISKVESHVGQRQVFHTDKYIDTKVLVLEKAKSTLKNLEEWNLKSESEVTEKEEWRLLRYVWAVATVLRDLLDAIKDAESGDYIAIMQYINNIPDQVSKMKESVFEKTRQARSDVSIIPFDEEESSETSPQERLRTLMKPNDDTGNLLREPNVTPMITRRSSIHRRINKLNKLGKI